MLTNREKIEEAVSQILIKNGAKPEYAQIVAEELADADMMGLGSHGALRITQYLDDIEKGVMQPAAEVKVIKESPATAVVDAGYTFGQIVSRRMVNIVCEKAVKTGIACAISINARHVGRVGSYTEAIAKRGLIGFATVGVYNVGPMAPWGGKEPRLSTNPITWAAPRPDEPPVFMDGATTVVSEGKLREYVLAGKEIPEGWVRDAYGNDTTNPQDLYGPPCGTIYPLGGKIGGAKGYGLAIMANMFSIALGNDEYWSEIMKGGFPRCNNSIYLMAMDPEFFCGREAYEAQVKAHCDFIKSSEPAEGFKEVLLPGEFEHRKYAESLEKGCYLADDTWNNLLVLGKRYGCDFCKDIDVKTEMKNVRLF